MNRPIIFIINGSAGRNSANQKLIDFFVKLTNDFFDLKVFPDLKLLPHFNPELSIEKTPQVVLDFRKEIELASAVLICTPEYVFSIPSGLKNAIEWCVSTTVFSEKPTGIITASASGQKGHEELQLIMKTVGAKLSTGSNLLIQGIKGKMNDRGDLVDNKANQDLMQFIEAFKVLIEKSA
jgi:chromate reductase